MIDVVCCVNNFCLNVPYTICTILEHYISIQMLLVTNVGEFPMSYICDELCLQVGINFIINTISHLPKTRPLCMYSSIRPKYPSEKSYITI